MTSIQFNQSMCSLGNRAVILKEVKLNMADDSTLAMLTDNSTTFSTLDSSQSQSNSSRGLDVTRDELEKRQLMHTIQLLKLEVSQKQLILESVKNEQASQLEELREKLADVCHEKKLLSLRLQSMTAAYEQELKVVKETSCRDLAACLEQPQSDVRHEIELALQDPCVSDEEYHSLLPGSSATLSLANYIRVRWHELTKPIVKQNKQFRSSVDELSQELRVVNTELTHCQEELRCSKEQMFSLERDCLRQTEELTSTKTLIQEGNYKIDNFDAVQRSRDVLKKQLERVKHSLEERETGQRVRDEENHKVAMELSSLTQTVELLKQDKQYLERQLAESKQRCHTVMERNEHLRKQLEEAKMEKEKALHQLVHSKEEGRLEYERKLYSEIESVTAHTTLEVEQLKSQTKEMNERENRSLREARESAMDERDRAVVNEKETSQKFENLLKEHHALQSSCETRIGKLQGKLQLAYFERDRNQLLNLEMAKDLKHCQLEVEKLQKKNGILTQELWSTETMKGAALKETEARLKDTQQKLESYEKIEKELDDIVLQSAQVTKDCDADKVLFSYGFGASVPTTSRRRLQQSVQLAQRVLHLERINTALKNQLEDGAKRNTLLQQKLHRSEELLGKAQQPHSCLLEDIQQRDHEVVGERQKCLQLEGEITALKEERTAMMETRYQMASDLERLLSHREELHLIKQVLLGLLNKQQSSSSQEVDKPNPLKPSNRPPPTQFTKPGLSKNSTHY